jgi:hypothetical protein
MFVTEAKQRGMVINNFDGVRVAATTSTDTGTYDSQNPYEILAQYAQGEQPGAKPKRSTEI